MGAFPPLATCAGGRSAGLFPHVSLLTQLERRFGWAAFPGLIRFIALFQLLTLGLTFINQSLPQQLAFDYQAIMNGEIWRAFTFVFLPKGGMGMLSVLFAVFAAIFLMIFGDGLEREWGPFQTSLYVYLGWFTCLVGAMGAGALGLGVGPMGVVPFDDAISPALIFDLSILFAFAVHYPKFEFLFMLIIPMRISVLAIIAAVLLLLQCVRAPILLPYALICLGNFFLFLGPGFVKGAKARGETKKRRVELARKSIPEGEAFHRCERCGATEQSNPEREFRVDAENGELCSECMEASEHQKMTS